MLSETDKYKLSTYVIKEKLHSSKNCIIYLTQSSISNKLYIKRVYENSYMLDIFNTIKNKRVRNTPEIFEVFYDGKDTIIIEEYILAYTAEEITLSKTNLYKIINQILLSVEDLHSINIIHRDIKPSNILVTKDYKAYLIDFGIARFHSETLDTDTTKSGTKGFASPEQYGFQQTDFRSDIYSIGKTIESLVKSNNINYGLKKVISKSISFDPKDRYSSVNELKRAVNINRFRIILYVLPVIILFLILICFRSSKISEINENNINTDTTNFNAVITETTSETYTEIITYEELTEQTSEYTTSVPIVKPQTTSNTQLQTPKTNNSVSEKPKVSQHENMNILKFQSDKFYFNGLIVPDGTDVMESLGNESSKTCSIGINNTYVAVQCIKNNSTLTVNLSDNIGHKDSFTMNISEEQLKNSPYPDEHSFNAYIYFLDYNNDGKTEIFVNFTDMFQPLNDSGELITIDYGYGPKPYVLKNRNMLKLIEHDSTNGFYVYKEIMTTYSDNLFTVGGNYTNGIHCNENSTIFKPHNGVITEESI